MEIDLNKIEVKNNPEKSRFEAQIDPYLAVIDYYLVDNTIVFTHTGVPSEISTRGIGTLMAKTALQYARAEGLQVIPQCPFVAAYIARHPEYQDLVASS